VRRATLSLTLLALMAASASPAAAGGLDLRIGGFFPRGNETLFQDDRELFFVEKKDFYGVYGGIEYNHVLMDNVELGIHLDGYGRTVDTSYREYTRPSGDEILQSLKLTMVPLGVSIRFVPTSKRARIAPFVGGGVDAIFYKYEEFGDFIDFFDPELPIVGDAFVSEGMAFGFHVLGGVRVYVNRDIAVVGEGRYQWAKDEMGDDFAPTEPGLVNTLDLSGATFTVGVHIRF
jgi:opacity protein-like surface antigen